MKHKIFRHTVNIQRQVWLHVCNETPQHTHWSYFSIFFRDGTPPKREAKFPTFERTVGLYPPRWETWFGDKVALRDERARRHYFGYRADVLIVGRRRFFRNGRVSLNIAFQVDRLKIPTSVWSPWSSNSPGPSAQSKRQKQVAEYVRQTGTVVGFA